ncbi:MAG: hypothetical protein ACRD2C_13665 [Acidimicrobiales bacterium]
MPINHSPSRPARSRPATLAVLVVAFAVGACGGSDDSDEAETQSVGVDDATITSAADEDAVDTHDSTDDAAATAPQDSDLDVEVRSPDGTMLTLSHIAFDGDDILVDMEIVNSSPERISVHRAFYPGAEDDLRLVDDAGNSYNFVLPPENQSAGYLDVLQGETLSGTFAFLGPVTGHPDQLRLVTNVATDEIDSWSVDSNLERGATSPGPGFVVPIDLTWD